MQKKHSNFKFGKRDSGHSYGEDGTFSRRPSSSQPRSSDNRFGSSSQQRSSDNRFGSSQTRSSDNRFSSSAPRSSGSRYGSPSQSRGSGNRFGSSSRRKRGESIDISLFVRKATVNPEQKYEITNSFSDFPISDILKQNLINRNYITPTPIQDQAINPIIAGKDLIGLANTGTGKTAAFLLPLIDKVSKDKSQKVLIIAPTRELALQIDDEFRQFSWGMKIFSAACVGGSPIHKQINNLKRSPNFVIGTPGRLKDLSDRRLVQLETFNNIVIDEIDRMLDMGFIDDIRGILAQLPETKQSLFFSATLPDKIRLLVNTFLIDPVVVEIKQGKTAENVDQDIVRVRDRAIKFNQLEELLKGPSFSKVLIFAETKIEVERLAENLDQVGFKAQSIHGDKRQRERQHALRQFKENQVNILVATDVAARGIDVKDISHVINYTIPQTYNDYIHRIGRTGRGDKKGMALTFV